MPEGFESEVDKIRIPPAEDRQDCPDQWLHEIKYDGYRLRIERDGAAVR
jgi:ATP-dependent DNA ligase